MAHSPALEAALETERIRSARYLIWCRALFTCLWAGVHGAIFVATGAMPAGHGFPAIMTYAAVGLLLLALLATPVRPALLRYCWYSIALIDIPILTWAAMATGTSDANGLMNVISGVSTMMLLVVATQLSFQVRSVLFTGVVAAGLYGAVLVYLHAGTWAAPIVLCGFPALIGLCIYVPRRVTALVENALADQAARVREVELLNEELRRQIGDRARQLSEALARLSSAGPVARGLLSGALVEDRYRVIDKLGAGGMGAVYRVARVSDGRELALKVLTGSADREALVRFAREAQIAAELHHPNVVSVVDVDVSQSGMLYLVMELVAGSTLSQQRDRFGDEKWALPILRQIAAALSAMHARGIVHRDLKPSNILLDGQIAKVADFGIASLRSSPPGEGDSTITRGQPLTETGAFMGTPQYMAPELRDGARAATPSSDLFSLGVIAFEMLTRRLPFSAPPVLDRTPPTPLAQLRPDLPPSLIALVDGCLALLPAERPGADAFDATCL